MIERSVLLPARAGEVWRALSEPDGLSDWFGADASVDGARILFRWPDGSERAATIETLEPERELSFRWAPFARDPAGRARQMPQTRVTLTLEPDGDATMLHVAESEPARATGVA